MCGINGIIFKNSKIDEKKILSMNELLAHRGPDQSGYIKHNNFLLGHTRLSILDTSSKGFQPMTNDGKYWIAYNGEIYNYRDLKRELVEKNHKFFSETDTEVVLNAFKEWGDGCFKRFNGEWAVAIFNKVEETLTLCRDGIGYKPCYLYEDKEYIAFSSEIKGFSPLKKIELDPANFGINGATLQSTCKTKFDNIEILRHGRILKINLKSLDKEIKRWDYPLKNLPKINSGYIENTKDFYSLLYQSTNIRLNSDVKVGTSLSGGIDSSAIFTLLNTIEKKSLNKNSNLDLNPVIINYDGMKTKEDAVDLVNRYNKKYNIINFKDLNYEKVQNELVSLETSEEFFMQKSIYEHQKNNGIKVSIDGHGADEFLFYPNWIPQTSIDIINNISNLYKTVIKFGKTSTINKFKNIFGIKELFPNHIEFKARLDLNNYFKNYTENSEFDCSYQYIDDDLDSLDNFSYELNYTYLMAYCGWFQFFLNKWDRASMANSVEVRMPFLDENVRLFNLALSGSNKFRKGTTKSILRDAFKDFFPKKIFQQDFKQGLNKQEFKINEKHRNFMMEILSQEKFKSISFFKHSQIIEDFSKNINIPILWELCKHYLMITGFEKSLNNINVLKPSPESFNYLSDTS